MGRFKAEAILVRKLDDITIVFYDWKSIYVFCRDDERATIFHRWFDARGSYKTYWQIFRRKLLRTKHLNLLKCYEIAATYDVQSICTVRHLDLSKRKVKYIYE